MTKRLIKVLMLALLIYIYRTEPYEYRGETIASEADAVFDGEHVFVKGYVFKKDWWINTINEAKYEGHSYFIDGSTVVVMNDTD